MIDAILMLHIMAGFIALGTAGLALGTRKGGTWHRRAGQGYVMAMLIVTLTTFPLVAVRPNTFLLVIAIFSFYLVFTGWRAAVMRAGRPHLPDHLGGAAMALTGAAMLGLGVVGLAEGGAQPVALLVFGTIGLTMALSDWRDWAQGPITGKPRIARHLTRMLAGTIATITATVAVNMATVAVNITFLPQLLIWLGPTALITPLIFWWNARVLRPG